MDKKRFTFTVIGLLLCTTFLPIIQADISSIYDFQMNVKTSKASTKTDFLNEDIVEIEVTKHRADGTVEKSIKELSKEKALELRNKLESREHTNNTLSIFKEYGLISDNITDDQLYEEMLKGVERYGYSQEKVTNLSEKQLDYRDWIMVPFALNFLCKVDSVGSWISIPVGLSLITGIWNYWILVFGFVLPFLIYFALPTVDLLYLAAGMSIFVCEKGLLPDFFINDKGSYAPCFYSLMGFVGITVSFPFFPAPFCSNYGFSIATFAIGLISIDWPIPAS